MKLGIITDIHSNIIALEVNSDIYVYGHTHVVCINNKENKWFINVGSLGCPLQSNIANAGVLDIKDDKINFEHLAIPYEADKVIKEIKKLNFHFMRKY